jgi:leucyl aminopeptidase
MKLRRPHPQKLAATGLLVLFAPQGSRPEPPASRSLRAPSAEFKGEFRGRVADALAGPAKRVLAIGLGKKDTIDAEKLRRGAALSVQRAEGLGAASATIVANGLAVDPAGGAERAGTALAEGAILGAYKFEMGKSQAKEAKLKATTLVGSGAPFARGVERGQITAAANAFVRDLQNQPANLLTPRELARRRRSARSSGSSHRRRGRG